MELPTISTPLNSQYRIFLFFFFFSTGQSQYAILAARGRNERGERGINQTSQTIYFP
ncbi:hypothetical protein P3X46_024535 [Hevea brasiliensis]|uniref:Uncharacterized protein n=1 Tax=Hevea brasiliensis TaxID=3981 RepID=A0ABQ9L620_HEVBR|nr:hypothetical protein P3X46_024535 [Hevea brasiliensis]